MNVVTNLSFDLGEGGLTVTPSFADGFAAELHDCQACTVRAGARQVVLGEGPSTARVLFLGSAPGPEDDQVGRSFTGPAGTELDVWLAALGLERGKVALSYAIRCHLANNRPAKVGEAIACRAIWFAQELDALPDLQLIVPLGNPATQSVLGAGVKVDPKALYWQYGQFKDRKLAVFPLPHPSFIIRTVTQRQNFLSATLPIVAAEMRKQWPELYDI